MIAFCVDPYETLAYNLRTAAMLWLAWAGGAATTLYGTLCYAAKHYRVSEDETEIERYEWSIPKSERRAKLTLVP